jgi:transporter family protein
VRGVPHVTASPQRGATLRALLQAAHVTTDYVREKRHALRRIAAHCDKRSGARSLRTLRRIPMQWLLFALISAGAAAATAILAKIGVRDVPSNVATAVRTVVVLVFAFGIVIARGEYVALRTLQPRSVVFLIFSGVATGISWLAYFHALQLAPASRVAPIDKLSLPLTVLLAGLLLGETLSWRLIVGALLMVAGALLSLEA